MKKLFIFLSLLYVYSAQAYHTTNISNQCGIIPFNQRAVFKPIEYTCNNGQFLPANTTGCRSCPTGYTCNGGTFAFNPTQSQGATKTDATLITQNKNNTCASNVSHDLYAVFERNTINLTWIDRGNIVSESQCLYGMVIPDIPNDPVRQGYVFSGWRVKPSQSE